MNRKITSEMLEKIKEFEGLRLKAYLCQANKMTIGYGHTQGVKQGAKITEEQAEDYLIADLKYFEDYVTGLENKYGYAFNQNQFDALTSFFFNLGKLGGQLTNYGKRDIETIGKKMLEYCKYRKSGKLEVSSGLLKRRQYESNLFLKNYTPFQGTSDVKQEVQNNVKKASYVCTKFATGLQIYIKKVTALCSDNCITPIEYLENETVTFYGYYNKDIVTEYLLVKTKCGKVGYIKNTYLDL